MTSSPNSLQKAPPSNTTTLGIRFSTDESGGHTNILACPRSSWSISHKKVQAGHLPAQSAEHLLQGKGITNTW